MPRFVIAANRKKRSCDRSSVSSCMRQAVEIPAADRFEAEAMPHLNDIFRTATRLLGERSRAEDIAQEVYLQAWKSFHRFETGTNCRAWLFKILFHCVNHPAEMVPVPAAKRDRRVPGDEPDVLASHTGPAYRRGHPGRAGPDTGGFSIGGAAGRRRRVFLQGSVRYPHGSDRDRDVAPEPGQESFARAVDRRRPVIRNREGGRGEV